MSKYRKFERPVSAKKEMNPVWRGVGCILMVVVPLMAYGFTIIFVPPLIATGYVPREILGNVRFPDWVFHYRFLVQPAGFISSITNLWMYLITFFMMLLILSSVISLIYAMVYALFGPPPYSEFDAPPSKYKPKKYTR